MQMEAHQCLIVLFPRYMKVQLNLSFGLGEVSSPEIENSEKQEKIELLKTMNIKLKKEYITIKGF